MNSELYEKIEHLRMIQNVINRMARSSAFMKTYAVVLTAVFFMSASVHYFERSEIFAFIGLACLSMVAALCYMDSLYLRLERGYVALHGNVSSQPEATGFEMRPSYIPGLFATMFSWSVAVFYGPLLIGNGMLLGWIIANG